MPNVTDADYISSFIAETLQEKGLLRSPVPLRRYRQGGEDPDSKLVFMSEGEPALVVTVSPPEFPDVVAEECLRAAQMRSRLGDLGRPVLEPLDTGRVQTSSYAVLPFRKPFSRRRVVQWIHRNWARHHVLEWLLQIAQRRSASCEPSRYEASLQALSEKVRPDSPTAALLAAAGEHLCSGRFVPKSAPMHGDLWRGNVLRGSESTAFTLVDWRGSQADGFPIFDLIRLAESFGLSTPALGRELRRHQSALGCQVADLPLYLVGALGHYAAHLGEMSLALFQTMADGCATRIARALSAPVDVLIHSPRAMSPLPDAR